MNRDGHRAGCHPELDTERFVIARVRSIEMPGKILEQSLLSSGTIFVVQMIDGPVEKGSAPATIKSQFGTLRREVRATQAFGIHSVDRQHALPSTAFERLVMERLLDGEVAQRGQ
jgi:hypothetical protein